MPRVADAASGVATSRMRPHAARIIRTACRARCDRMRAMRMRFRPPLHVPSDSSPMTHDASASRGGRRPAGQLGRSDFVAVREARWAASPATFDRRPRPDHTPGTTAVAIARPDLFPLSTTASLAAGYQAIVSAMIVSATIISGGEYAACRQEPAATRHRLLSAAASGRCAVRSGPAKPSGRALSTARRFRQSARGRAARSSACASPIKIAPCPSALARNAGSSKTERLQNQSLTWASPRTDVAMAARCRAGRDSRTVRDGNSDGKISASDGPKSASYDESATILEH